MGSRVWETRNGESKPGELIVSGVIPGEVGKGRERYGLPDLSVCFVGKWMDR